MEEKKKQITKNFKGLNMRGLNFKLMSNIVLMSLLPFLLMIIFSYVRIHHLEATRNEQYSKSLLTQLNNNLGNNIINRASMVDTLSEDFRMMEAIKTNDEEFVKGKLKEFNSENTDERFYVLTDNGLYSEKSFNTKITTSNDTFVDKSGTDVMFAEIMNDDGKYIIISKAIMDVTDNSKVLGYLYADINISSFSEEINSVDLGKNDGILVYSPDNKLVINTLDEKKLKVEGNQELTNILTTKSGYFEAQNYYFTKGVEETTGWTIIIAQSKEEQTAIVKSIRNTMFMLFIIIGAISMTSMYFMVKKIIKTVRVLQVGIDTAAKGVLSDVITIKTNDEFEGMAHSINVMTEEIGALIGKTKTTSSSVSDMCSEVKNNSESTTTLVTELSSAMNEIADDTLNLSMNVQETLESMTTLSSDMEVIDENTQQINAISSNANELSSQGLKIVADLVQASELRSKAGHEVVANFKATKDNIDEIKKISETISEINSQTDLLSLNASIEAARAGDAGKGFAVVANEVRALSEQTARATKNIDSLINSLLGHSNSTVEALKKTDALSKQQESAIQKTEVIFTDINNQVTILFDKIVVIEKLINNMVIQNKEMIEKVNSNAQIAERSAATIEEVTANSSEVVGIMESLEDQTNDLQKMIDNLQEELSIFVID